jgi:uncharacterized membrane protein YhaH (DUF805 family)
MNLIDILTRLDGRIGRKSFWIGTLVLTAIFIAVIFALMVMLGEEVLDGPYSGNSATMLVLQVLSVIASIPVMLKRLHDLNRSYGLLAPFLVMEGLTVIGDLTGLNGSAGDPSAFGWTLVAVYGVYGLALIIYLGFYRGTQGPNDFGPDPLAPEEIPASVNL